MTQKVAFYDLYLYKSNQTDFMKNILFASALMLLWIAVSAQTIQVNNLSSSIGNWEGKLTYLDYSSGNPYTMIANIKIKFTADKKGYVMGYEYPKEPHANSKDTTFIIDNFFGKDKIIEFKKDSDGGFRLVTEIVGEDGNDHKKAILRHTYQLISNTYSITKEVKFEGSDIWIKRNEYLLNRIGN